MPVKYWIPCELAHSGFGSIRDIMKTEVDVVMAAYDYIKFRSEYERQCFELGKEKDK